MRRAASQLTRIHVPDRLAPGALIDIPPPAAHHLVHVLRASVGDRVVIFGGGAEYDAAITRIDKRGVAVTLAAGSMIDRESPLACTLAQSISSGDRMDHTLQKSVELGAVAIQPLYSERSIVRLGADRVGKRIAHWQQIVVSACEQCGRNVVPPLAAPRDITEWLAALPPAPGGELRLLLSPHAEVRPQSLVRPARSVLLAGPEGGFTETETRHAVKCGFIPVRLGPRVLRTETAALAALAAMQALWGDF
jgi:16S rRNA (uracil1498-N3)-methyltransferase